VNLRQQDVEDAHVIASRDELVREMRPDETGAARDQHSSLHERAARCTMYSVGRERALSSTAFDHQGDRDLAENRESALGARCQ
jgi:hypothetical protein